MLPVRAILMGWLTFGMDKPRLFLASSRICAILASFQSLRIVFFEEIIRLLQNHKEIFQQHLHHNHQGQ